MKRSAVILFLSLSSFAFGQAKQTDSLKEKTGTGISGLIPVDTIALSDITGDYSGPRGDGEFIISGSWKFHLDSNGSVTSFEYGCYGTWEVDNGFWSVKKNMLQLELKKRTVSLEIFKLSNFYFFLLPSQHKYLASDLHSLKEIAEEVKPLVLDDYMMAHCLATSYFSKEIKRNLSEAVLPTINRD